jgi:hypothetical protein
MKKENLPHKVREVFLKLDLGQSLSWEDFGVTWTWAKEQEWWNIFTLDAPSSPWIQTCFINPDRFADAVSKYLKWEDL